jgi:hypothetical protein
VWIERHDEMDIVIRISLQRSFTKDTQDNVQQK